MKYKFGIATALLLIITIYLVRALGILKKAAAKVNMEMGILDKTIGTAICAAADPGQVEILHFHAEPGWQCHVFA